MSDFNLGVLERGPLLSSQARGETLGRGQFYTTFLWMDEPWTENTASRDRVPSRTGLTAATGQLLSPTGIFDALCPSFGAASCLKPGQLLPLVAFAAMDTLRPFYVGQGGCSSVPLAARAETPWQICCPQEQITPGASWQKRGLVIYKVPFPAPNLRVLSR